VYGCTGKTQFRLGQNVRCADCIGPIRVAGVLVAYGRTIGGYDTVTARVTVRSLANGKRLFDSLALREGDSPPQGQSAEVVTSLVLVRNGDLGWIAEDTFSSPRIIEVHRAQVCLAHRSQSRPRCWHAELPGRTLLDSGPPIHARSLRRRGSDLSWRHGSTMRTARLG
jgi:hypothetical protein